MGRKNGTCGELSRSTQILWRAARGRREVGRSLRWSGIRSSLGMERTRAAELLRETEVEVIVVRVNCGAPEPALARSGRPQRRKLYKRTYIEEQRSTQSAPLWPARLRFPRTCAPSGS